jgi:hypothetical protein
MDFSRNEQLLHLGLAPLQAPIAALGGENQVIGELVLSACVRESCGARMADALRDFLIEYTRNTFQHSGATWVHIRFDNNRVLVAQDGRWHDTNSLLDKGERGGSRSLRALLDHIGVNVLATKRAPNGDTLLIIPLVSGAEQLLKANPCAIRIDIDQLRSGSTDFSSVASCDTVYVVAPDFLSYSDGDHCARLLADLLSGQRRAVLVLPNVSKDVADYFADRIAGIRIIRV